MKSKQALLALVLVLGLVIVIVLLSQNRTDDFGSAEVALALPVDAIQLSPCIPFMGEHWARVEDLPSGPIYLIHDGEVIGSEYMILENRLEGELIDVFGEQVGIPVSLPSLGVKYDHIDLGFEPHGHEGMEEAHYDVHNYLITPEEKFSICPPQGSADDADEWNTQAMIEMYSNMYPSETSVEEVESQEGESPDEGSEEEEGKEEEHE